MCVRVFVPYSDWWWFYASICPSSPLQNIHRRAVVRCLCKHFSTPLKKTSYVYKKNLCAAQHIQLTVWMKMSAKIIHNLLFEQADEKKRNNQVFEAQTHTYHTMPLCTRFAPMVAAIVLAFVLGTTSHSPFTVSTHFVLMPCIRSEQRSRFRPTINWNEADHLHFIVNHLLYAANAFQHRSSVNDPHHQLAFAFTKSQAWKMISIDVQKKLKNHGNF